MLNDQVIPNRLHPLSTFVSDKLAGHRQAREDDLRRRLDAYQQELANRQAEWTSQKIQCARAWKECRFLSLLCKLWGLFLLSLKGSDYLPQLAAPSVEEKNAQKGLEGENRVQQALFAIIPESWRVISGYRNDKGETDFILVTPNGLMVIEVKTRRGLICCQGDDWFVLNNAWGRRYYIRDNGGRSPSQQVNEVANSLEEFFRNFAPNLGVGPIKRAVVFAAHNSGIYLVEQPCVDLVCTLDSLTLELLLDFLPPRIPSLDTEKLLKMIKKDHKFHHNKWLDRRVSL